MSDRKKYYTPVWYVEDSIKIAKELCYSDNVIDRLEQAKTEKECVNILHDARTGVLK